MATGHYHLAMNMVGKLLHKLVSVFCYNSLSFKLQLYNYIAV